MSLAFEEVGRNGSAHSWASSALSLPHLLDLMPAAVCICDRDGVIVKCNGRAVEFWGRTPKLGDTAERFCGSYRLYRLDGSSLSHAECPMADVLRSGEPVRDRQVVIERPDGSRIIALTNVEAVRDEAGAIAGAISCFQDITGPKRAEEEERKGREALRKQEWQSRELLDALPAAVYTTDAAGRITYFNRAAAELAGREPTLGSDEWCVTWRLFWLDGRSMSHDQCPMAVALKEHRPVRGEEAIAERPDGTRVPFIPYPMPLHDMSGVLVGAVNMLVDISERKAFEESLHQGEERLAAELEATRHLQAVSTQLIHERDTTALYERIIDAAVSIMHSDFASMQMFHPERGEKGELELLAFRGFDPEAARFWKWVRADSGCTCGEAMRTGQRVIASDVETCDFMAGTPDRTVYLEAGMHAVQSTPLVSRSGRLLGMISTHWRKPHSPSDSELQRFDVLARQAADLIERAIADAALRESETRLAQEVADMQRLDDFSRRLLERNDLNVIMHDVLVTVTELLKVAKASVQLCEPAGRGLHLISTVGFDRDFEEKFQFVEACGFTTCAAASALLLRTSLPIPHLQGLRKLLRPTEFVQPSQPRCLIHPVRYWPC